MLRQASKGSTRIASPSAEIDINVGMLHKLGILIQVHPVACSSAPEVQFVCTILPTTLLRSFHQFPVAGIVILHQLHVIS